MKNNRRFATVTAGFSLLLAAVIAITVCEAAYACDPSRNWGALGGAWDIKSSDGDVVLLEKRSAGAKIQVIGDREERASMPTCVRRRVLGMSFTRQLGKEDRWTEIIPKAIITTSPKGEIVRVDADTAARFGYRIDPYKDGHGLARRGPGETAVFLAFSETVEAVDAIAKNAVAQPADRTAAAAPLVAHFDAQKAERIENRMRDIAQSLAKQ